MPASFWRRLTGTPLVALLVMISVPVSLYHFVAHEAPILPTLLGQLSLFLAALCFGAVGWYALNQAETVHQRSLIGTHAFGMFGIAGLASAGYEFHQYLSPEVAVPEEAILFQALFVALLAAMIGSFTGLEAARREQTLTDLQLERDKFSKMFENIRLC